MKWSKSGLWKHYIKIRLEGGNPEIFLNLCMRKGVRVTGIQKISDVVTLFSVNTDDYRKVVDIAGNRYKIRVMGRRGFWYRVRSLLGKRFLIIGLLVFSGLLYYQSLFVSEIQVNGYESLNEQAIRKSLKEAGLHEGCRKNIDLTQVKLHLYDEYDIISWVGIEYDGNLACVSIAEGGKQYNAEQTPDGAPCNIVADREGYIESIIPEVGMRMVEDGTFVREGTVLISGLIPLQSTAYGTESENKTETYVHAAGTVKAKIPVHLNFYICGYDTVIEETGRKRVYLSVNGHDLSPGIVPYKTSSAEYVDIINMARPFVLKIQLVSVDEVTVRMQKITEKTAREIVLNEIHKYTAENLPEDTEILNKSLNFSREKNIINIGVTLETLQQIGIEEEIIIDNSNGKSEKNDDQRGD